MLSSDMLRVLTVFLIFLSSLSGQESARPLEIERAHYYENVLSEWDKAQALYEKISADPEVAPRWRAEATYGLARCHDAEENYVTANKYYLRVIRNYSRFTDLAEEASQNILEISKLLAEDDTGLSEEDHSYLAELVMALSISLHLDQKKLTQTITSELEKHLRVLRKSVKGTEDEELLVQMAAELKSLFEKKDLTASQRARELADSENLGGYVGSIYEKNPGEVFNQALRWKDQMAIALSARRDQDAIRLAEKITTYLSPLLTTPDDDVRSYANILNRQAQKIRTALVKKDLSSAATAFFEHEQTIYQKDLAILLYLEEYEDNDPAHYPALYSCIDHLEEAVGRIESSPPHAIRHLEHSLSFSKTLATAFQETEHAQKLSELRDTTSQALQLLRQGKTKEALTLLTEE